MENLNHYFLIFALFLLLFFLTKWKKIIFFSLKYSAEFQCTKSKFHSIPEFSLFIKKNLPAHQILLKNILLLITHIGCAGGVMVNNTEQEISMLSLNSSWDCYIHFHTT